MRDAPERAVQQREARLVAVPYRYLLEIDEAAHLLRKGQRVIDLGCAPGGWIQVALLKGAAEVAGIDLLPLDTIDGATILEGDVNNPADVAKLLAALSGPPDLVLSDMAANTTGHKQTDHLRTVTLVELAVDFAIVHLAPGGSFCSKVFQGGTTQELLVTLKAHFRTVKHIKPPASRSGWALRVRRWRRCKLCCPS
jgi:23S rRNA (uridine2552-2'-O)-methyltransferase